MPSCISFSDLIINFPNFSYYLCALLNYYNAKI
nr:MAG TPA: hypothetical protein [Caudoviricetes sp.]